jgi:hypothetical protein
MSKEIASEFSLQVRRNARRIQVIAAARDARAMVLVLAVLALAVALAAYWLRAPVASTVRRSMLPPGARPRDSSWSTTSRAVSTPRLVGANVVLMTLTPPDPDPISTASESSRTVVS